MPKFIDIDQTLSTEAAATAKAAIAASDYVGAVRPVIAANGSTDDYAAIQAALDTGADVVLSGPTGSTETVNVKTSATLILTAVGQRLTTVNARISPAFLGDAVRITAQNQHANVEITSTLQPVSGDYEEVAAIRIGLSDQSENPKNASVAGSRVTGLWKGNGIIWEHGAHINFSHFSVDFGCTFDGIRATPNCDDNNEGNFSSPRVSNCQRYGYWIKNNAGVPTNSSRGHFFSNAKAFGCLKNFVIETRDNVGYIFSENGTNPDEFTATSLGNDISFAETNAMYASVSDLGSGNRISGKNSFNNWDTQKFYARTLYINNPTTGGQYLTFAQTSNVLFTDSIIGTNNNITVAHNSAGSGVRTDAFRQLGCSLIYVNNSAVSGQFLTFAQTVANTFTDSISGTNNNVSVVHNSAGSGVRSDGFQNVSVSGSLDFGTGDTTVTRTSAGQIAVEGNPVGIKVGVPASAGAAGVVGQWAAESGWLYICIATNTWQRVAIATWP